MFSKLILRHQVINVFPCFIYLRIYQISNVMKMIFQHEKISPFLRFFSSIVSFIKESTFIFLSIDFFLFFIEILSIASSLITHSTLQEKLNGDSNTKKKWLLFFAWKSTKPEKKRTPVCAPSRSILCIMCASSLNKIKKMFRLNINFRCQPITCKLTNSNLNVKCFLCNFQY